METTFSIIDLFKHCWRVIRQGGYTKGRISRGEYFVSSAILTVFLWLLTLLLSAVIPFDDSLSLISVSTIIFAVLFLAINILSFILWVKLLIKRAHDLDKSWWWILKMSVWPLLIIWWVWFLVSILFWLLSNVASASWWSLPVSADWGLVMTAKTAINRILWALALLALFSTLYVLFVLFFKKWTDWENRFGPDPLLTQPKGDGVYWILRLILFVVYGTLSVTLNRQSLEDAFNQGAQEMGDSMILTGEELWELDNFVSWINLEEIE